MRELLCAAVGLTLATAGVMVPAWSSEPTPQATAAAPGASAPLAPGDATRAWLAGQAAGQSGSPIRPTLSGPVLRKVHERYVNSFGQPIPERFPTAGR